MKNLLLFVSLFFNYLFIFSQSPPSSCAITRTSSSPTTTCTNVTFHVVATNNLGTLQHIELEVFTLGISNISSTTAHSATMTPGHFLFNLGTFSAYGTAAFDFSYNIPCTNIPVDLSHGRGSFPTNGILRSNTFSLGAPTYSFTLPTIATSYDWVNLYYSTIPPTSGLIAYSHVGQLVTRSIRVNIGTSSPSTVNFTGDVQFADDMSSSCGMGKDSFVSMSIYNALGTLIGSPVAGIPAIIPNTYNFTMPVIPPTSDQYLVFTEIIRIIEDSAAGIKCLDNCGSPNALSSELKVNWGCNDTDLCHTINVEAIIYKDAAVPVLEISELTPIPAEGCIDSFPSYVTHTKRVTNTGATAYNINITIQTEFDGSTYLPSSQFVFDREISGNGKLLSIPFSVISDSFNFSYHPLGTHASISSCADALTTSTKHPIQTATYTVPKLGHGDYFQITYRTYHCCPSGRDDLVGNYDDPEYFDTWELSVKGYSECDDEADGNKVDAENLGARMIHLTQRRIPGPTHLTGGTSPDGCNFANTTIYHVQNLLFNEEAGPPYRNAQLFEHTPGGSVHGTLRVTIATQLGLNIALPTTAISIQDEATTSRIVKPINVIQTSSLGTSGGTWEIYFLLDSLTADSLNSDYLHLKNFLDNSVFNFPLTPCCQGEAIPTYTLQWDINPYNDYTGAPGSGDTRGCTNCWIPIATTSGHIHLMCPGCVTPGVIVDYVHLQRSTFGWPDDNNNGLANATGPPYSSLTDLISRGGYPYAGKNFMTGDELSCDIKAYGQDGDNTNRGFDYATMIANWGLRSPFASPYPNQFNYLNFYITDPCLPNWEIDTATLEVKIHGIGSTYTTPYDISPYKITSSGGAGHFYSIPFDSVPGGLTEYYVSDEYKVHIDYRVCGNAAPADCEYEVVMWWSSVPHTIYDAINTHPAGDDNGDLPSTTLPDDRVDSLAVNLRFYCEGNGDLVHGYQIKKTYTSLWSNHTLGGSYWNVNTCRKLCANTVNLKVIDISPGNNFFIKEYRPIDPHFISDHYYEPPSSPPDYAYDTTISLSRTNTYNSSGVTFSHLITNTSTIPEMVIDTPPPVNYTFTPAPPFNIARDGSYPFTLFPSPDREYNTADGNFYMGDENTDLVLNHYYKPTTCDSLPIVNVNSTGNFIILNNESCITPYEDSVINSRPVIAYGLKKVNPVLTLRLSTSTISVFSVNPTCFRLILKNTCGGTQFAENAFVYIPSPFPSSAINSVSIVTTSIPGTVLSSGSSPGNYFIVNIPTLKSLQADTLDICFTLDPCVHTTAFNFPIIFGYSCLGAMHDSTEVYNACEKDTLVITPHPAKVNMTGTITYPASIAPCDTARVTASYWVTDIGQVDNLHLLVKMPIGASVITPGAMISVPGGLSFTITGLTLTVIHDTLTPSFVTYDIGLPAGVLLPLGPATIARITYTFCIGACVTGSISPQIRLMATTYCNNYAYFPDSTLPALTHAIPVSGTPPFPCQPIKITLDGITDATCLGKNNGAINISVSYTMVPAPSISFVHYHWSNGSAFQDISALAPGVYTITVTDMFGCEQTATYTVHALTNPIHLPTIVSQPYTTCDTGIITFTPGVGTYIYSWRATNVIGDSTGTLAAGIYSIPLKFRSSSLGSAVFIRATDHSTPSDPKPCYDEMRIWIEPCCDRPETLISNSNAIAEFSRFISTDSFYHVTGLGIDYRINGILTINHDIVFQGSHFYMEPFSEIRVASGKTAIFKGCTLVACDTTMWKGIVVEAGATVNPKTTRIYDALAGITTIGNGKYIVELWSNFNRNYIDIDVKPLLASPSASTVTQSYFFCNSESPEYHGNDSLPGKLWYPYKNQITSIGINVLNNQLLTVCQLNTPADTFTNYFSDMNYGIYALNSAVKITNNHFARMTPIITYGTGGSSTTNAGDAIYFTANDPTIGTYAKNIDARHNAFDTIPHACAYLYGSEVQGDIDSNAMGYSLVNTCNFGILSNQLGVILPPAAPHKVLNIWGNNIYYTGGGIRLEANNRIKALINVTNNIYGPLSPPPPIFITGIAPIGIYVSTTTLNSGTAPWFIIDNNNIHNGQGGIGITSSTAPTSSFPLSYTNEIASNGIYSFDFNRTGYRGIQIQNSNNVKVSCNSINGMNNYLTAAAKNNQGIYLVNAKENLIMCNSMDSLNKGLGYFMNCSMVDKMAGNKFNRLNYHIYTSIDPLNVIGNQSKITIGMTNYFQANEMRDIHIFTPGNSIYNGGATYAFAIKPSPPALAIYDPNLQGVLFGMPPGSLPTSPLTYYTGCAVSCSPIPPIEGGGGTGHSMMMEPEEFALDLNKTTEMSYSSEEQGIKKLSEELLYDMLKSDTTLLENDTLQEFYDEKTGEHTGKLDEVKELINNKEYIDADAKLAILPLSNEAEEANKTVFEIVNKIQQRDTYTLTEDELNTLMVIAGYCPIKYGQAVYSARVLINTQYGYENMFWDDEELCVAGIDYRRSNPNIQTVSDPMTDKGFMIYPNPASTELNFSVKHSDNCGESNSKIEILDIVGNSVIKKEYDGFMQKGKINITILANGVYLIKYSCGNNEIYRQSFVVNK